VLVSTPWHSPFNGSAEVEPRASAWSLRGIAARKHHIRQAWRLHQRRDDVLIMTAGSEAIYLALFSLLTRRWLGVYDFLLPPSGVMRILGRLVLWRVNCWAVIRRGDAEMLARRFAVRRDRCAFVPFPATPTPPHAEATLGDYIYAAGAAYRDWATFIAAGDALSRRTVVSSVEPLPARRGWLDARSLVTPEEGRALSARARLVVVPMVDTEMPCGPVVVVDAQAHGKAVVASDVNGTRDYIEHGVTGWLIPPHSPGALAEQIRAVIDDERALLAVGQAARLAAWDARAVLDALRGLWPGSRP
jgi:glycosyl transferase family 1